MVQKAATISVENLLNALSPFLDQSGAIKSVEDCQKMCNCMKQLGKPMLNTCTYLNVILITDDDTILSQLMADGGWQILYDWLVEYKELDEVPVLLLLLNVFFKLPVTMEMLKSTKSAKLIKSLTKHSSDSVKMLATQTVGKWMSIIKSNSSSTNNGSSSPAHPSGHGEKHKTTEKKKKKAKRTDKSEKPPSESAETTESIDRDVPSPPPQPIFKESKNSSTTAAPTTAKQHNVKERSAGVEAGVIKPKPRGSTPKANATTSKKPASSTSSAAADASMSAHKRCVRASQMRKEYILILLVRILL